MSQYKSGRAVTPEEFKEIKDLQFRGEFKTDVAVKVDRSITVVQTAMEAETFEEYQQLTTQRNARYKAGAKNVSPLENIQVHTLKPSTNYGRLKVFREQLDEVLIDFIVGEVKQNQIEMVKENNRLRKENEALKLRLDELEGGSFITNLQDKLQPEEQPKAQPTEEKAVEPKAEEKPDILPVVQ